MSVVSSVLDVAGFLRERKGIKEEKSRYGTEQEALGKERLLKEQQIRQQMGIALQEAEREKARMAPGGIETRKILSAPYGVGVEEARPKVIPEGPGHKLARLQSSLAEKQVAGYETPTQTRAATGFETPAQQRTGEQDWEKKMAGIKQQYALELANLKGGAEEEVVPFDESGFNTQIFANIAGTLFPNYSFRDVYKNIGLEEVRKRIRFEAVANYGQNDPTKVQQIDDSLDEWLRFLFQMAGTLPEGENPSFGEVINKIGAWLTTPGPGLPQRLGLMSSDPQVEPGGPLLGLEFPGETKSDYQATLPKREDKERKLKDLFSRTKKKSKSSDMGITGLMRGH